MEIQFGTKEIISDPNAPSLHLHGKPIIQHKDLPEPFRTTDYLQNYKSNTEEFGSRAIEAS
jgi:hypothetical protein